jgi:UDP-2,4-diacetamido-2,4,6-trideoxy-beta-L-altropyranose hydrolase
LNVVIRADASTEIGSGHIMRCLSLAIYIKNCGGLIYFISSGNNDNLKEKVISTGFNFIEIPYSRVQNSFDQNQDANESISAVKKLKKIDWLVVDHYDLDIVWEKRMHPYVSKIMVIDDLANRNHDCDLLLDQNWLFNMECRYNDKALGSVHLIGPKYALLRDEFKKSRNILETRKGNIERVFVFFGGADPENFTGKVLQVLTSVEFKRLIVDVVIGEMNPNFDKIVEKVKKRPRTYLHVQIDSIAKLMSCADLSLGAGGSSTWERLCVGLPSIVWTLADNQKKFTKDLHEKNLLIWMGDGKDFSKIELISKLRQLMISHTSNVLWSDRCMKLVDGMGTKRVYQKMTRLTT